MMAGFSDEPQDLWLDRKGKPTKLHGTGRRYRVRVPPYPTEHFADGQKGKARERKRELLRMLEEGAAPLDKAQQQMLFSAYVEGWLSLQDFAVSTLSTNKGYLKNHLLPFFGDLPLVKIRHSTVVAWLAHMRKKPNKRNGGLYSPDTIELVYILLCTILKAAVNDERIPSHPCKNVPYPKAPDRPDVVVWEGDVVDKLLLAVPDPQHCILLLAAHCGHRQGEAFAVSIEDFRGADVPRGEIAIDHQVQRVDGELVLVPCKHNSIRRAPLPRGVEAALDLHLGRYPTLPAMPCTCPRSDHQGKLWRLLFHDGLPGFVPPAEGRRTAKPRGVPLAATDWNERVWHPALQRAGLNPKDPKKTGLHMLRHYCVSEWVAGRATMTEVQRWVGHKSSATTEKIYAHLFRRASERGRQIMDDVFAARAARASHLRVVGGE